MAKPAISLSMLTIAAQLAPHQQVRGLAEVVGGEKFGIFDGVFIWARWWKDADGFVANAFHKGVNAYKATVSAPTVIALFQGLSHLDQFGALRV